MSDGFFYVVQLVPDLRPTRLKLGWSRDVRRRVAPYRTAAPTFRILRVWPCHRSWEPSAIRTVAGADAVALTREAFDVADLGAALARAEGFFAADRTGEVSARPSGPGADGVVVVLPRRVKAASALPPTPLKVL